MVLIKQINKPACCAVVWSAVFGLTGCLATLLLPWLPTWTCGGGSDGGWGGGNKGWLPWWWSDRGTLGIPPLWRAAACMTAFIACCMLIGWFCRRGFPWCEGGCWGGWVGGCWDIILCMCSCCYGDLLVSVYSVMYFILVIIL